MGQFSWLDCVTGEQIIDNMVKDVYLLIPKEIGGGHVKEPCYDGYGHFGGRDVYDLVADWNRKWALENPDYVSYNQGRPLKEEPWYPFYSDSSYDREGVIEKWKEEDINKLPWPIEWRGIWIQLSCYDQDAKKILYPVKVTYDMDAVYEDFGFSPSDPNQGWLTEEEWETDDCEDREVDYAEFSVRVKNGNVYIDGKFIEQLCFTAGQIGCAVTGYLNRET